MREVDGLLFISDRTPDDILVRRRECTGDASKVEQLKFAEDKSPKMAEIPFNSINKYQVCGGDGGKKKRRSIVRESQVKYISCIDLI